MPEYRWNASDAAIGYDQAASHIHPHYLAIQDAILHELDSLSLDDHLIVDLGGGSGRLAERIAERYPHCRVTVVDQSESFLALASGRLARFGNRGRCVVARLQDPWEQQLSGQPTALVSMSAVHHLTPQEKQSLYARCYAAVSAGGMLLNGDEVRPEMDEDYRREVERWWQHMQRVTDHALVSPKIAEMLVAWKVRNLDQFGQPRRSGDDCHETATAQLGYFRAAGFASADVPWQADLWAILRATKSESH